ncbi:carboxypeptidase-like regulatory domain-containing protein [Flavobacterium sp. W1B]|uniref:carboxypeptidase-like regulatory domain-containing protein n=1 Tax=Flavobacterium sp. W1B TaxID=3394146 RepID=UPI0039BD7D24
MKQIIINSIFIVFLFQLGVAQNIKGKIIDAKTRESIPYANIKVNESENIVSNAEGYFTLSENNSQNDTMLTISYLGYINQQLTISTLKKLEFTISLVPGIFELSDVNVSNKKPNPYEIMANVKVNLVRNYKSDASASKAMLFYRRSNYFNPKNIEVEIDKSTGFTKLALKKVNTDIKNFTKNLISYPPQEFTDILCNYYTTNTKKEDKLVFISKLDVLKATKLKNEGSSLSSDELQKTAINTMLQHLDSTKYYRVKSGLFGSRDTISLRKDFNQKKNKNKTKDIKNQLTTTKISLNSFMAENNFLSSTKFNFINKPELYNYSYEGTTYTDDNEFAYVLNFKPRKSKAKYVGKLYISETDYAVIRAEYNLDIGEKLNNFNMKLLLGIKASENIHKGTTIYKKKSNENGYYLHYATVEKGQYFYINRPLKFIELTNNEKDVLALDIKLEGNSSTKTEFLNVSNSKTAATTIEKIKEEDFKFINIKAYDSKIWKDYNSIEPLEEMKRFKAIN